MPRLTMRRTLAVLCVMVVAAIVIVWLAREPIAHGALERALAARGVRAHYTVKNIGLRWERIEAIVIGDPRDPDLTADWTEVRLSAGLDGLSASAVRAGGVRIHGRVIDGRLVLGDIDKLLQKGSAGSPFTLPDLAMDIADTRVRLDTPWGRIAARIDGNGNLRDGFAGTLTAVAPLFGTTGCRALGAVASVGFAIRSRAPVLNGPVRAESIHCAGTVVAAPEVTVDMRLNEALDHWRGKARVKADGIAAQGNVLAGLGGQIGFDGTSAGTRGTAALLARSGRSGSARLVGISAKGSFATARGIAGKGTLQIARLLADPAIATGFAGAAPRAAGSPVAPLLTQLAHSARAVGEGVAVTANAAFGQGTAVISRLVATGRDGAMLRVEGGSGLRFGAAGFVADTRVQLQGAGFPTIESSFQHRADGMTLGLARIAPFASGGARLVLAPLRFAARPSGAALVESIATLDGPLGDGRVEGLRMAFAASMSPGGAIAVNTGCTPLSFRALSVADLTLRPASLRLCPFDGGALVRVADGRASGGTVVAAPQLAGKLGSTSITLAARGARLTLGANGFSVDHLTARLGTAARLSTLDVGSLTGRAEDGMVRGRFAAAEGKIGNVPLLIANAAGAWTLRGGALSIKGGATVSDAAVPGRFNPLVSDDIALRIADGRVAVTGTLHPPESAVVVTRVSLAHDLRSGNGTAALDVSGLRFDKSFQPDALTRLTLGVIANVEGEIHGRGDIRWTPAGVTSTGRFATSGIDLAAAFGPVTGLAGEIMFTDLLGLVTPPGQTVTLASVNPGVPVLGGQITYHLMPGQRIAVEGGRWPFAGGALLLDPAILDMGEARERRLTFRVEGLDAAKFIEQLKFENLAATGLFDGSIPMIFDAQGGRIAGGRIVARPGGGTLAYVGEVSNAQMNVFAKLAFDALKSIRYNNLAIALDGPLDGEMISRVDFTGVNEGPATTKKTFLARQFSNLPFKFNITIRAPFRSLLNTARTFQDPSLLLRQLPIQPPESEKRP